MIKQVIQSSVLSSVLGMVVLTIATIRPNVALAQEGGPSYAVSKGVIDDGRQDYLDNCAVCHGKLGKGDGPLRAFLTVKPSDLTQLAKKNNGQFNFWKTYDTIEGTGMLKAHGDNEMPVWGKAFKSEWGMTGTRARFLEVIFYLQSIQEK